MTNLNTLLAQLDPEKGNVLYPDVLTDKMIEEFTNTANENICIVDPSHRKSGNFALLELEIAPAKPLGEWNYIAQLPTQSIHIGTYPKMNLSTAQYIVGRLHAVMSDCDEYK